MTLRHGIAPSSVTKLTIQRALRPTNRRTAREICNCSIKFQHVQQLMDSKLYVVYLQPTPRGAIVLGSLAGFNIAKKVKLSGPLYQSVNRQTLANRISELH